MSEYIIEWSGIGARIVELIGSETPCLVVKRLRKERRREEIVRCRDCVYFDKYENDEISVCYRFDNEQPIVKPDGFCAWGERREG